MGLEILIVLTYVVVTIPDGGSNLLRGCITNRYFERISDFHLKEWVFGTLSFTLGD
jgi:hypothetical protein